MRARAALILLAWPLAASAAPPSPAARALDEARRHYAHLEYDQALIAIGEAERAAARDPERLAEALLLEGFVDVALEREDQAIAAFRRALAAQPQLKPGPEASPKLLAVFARAAEAERSRAARRAAARVKLSPIAPPEVAARGIDVTAEVTAPFPGLASRLAVDDPGGASASLPMAPAGDGRFLGHLPGELARAGARLTLRAELSDEGERFAESPPLALALPAHRAALRVETSLAGAELSIDGRPAGKTPFAGPIPVEPGRHSLSLRARAGRVTQEVQIAPGEIALATLAVAPPNRRAVARWTLVGVGGALSTAGAGLLVAATRASADLESAASAREPGSGLPVQDYASVSGFASEQRGLTIAAAVCLAAGAAAAASALLFLPRRDRPSRLAFAGVRF